MLFVNRKEKLEIEKTIIFNYKFKCSRPVEFFLKTALNDSAKVVEKHMQKKPLLVTSKVYGSVKRNFLKILQNFTGNNCKRISFQQPFFTGYLWSTTFLTFCYHGRQSWTQPPQKVIPIPPDPPANCKNSSFSPFQVKTFRGPLLAIFCNFPGPPLLEGCLPWLRYSTKQKQTIVSTFCILRFKVVRVVNIKLGFMVLFTFW